MISALSISVLALSKAAAYSSLTNIPALVIAHNCQVIALPSILAVCIAWSCDTSTQYVATARSARSFVSNATTSAFLVKDASCDCHDIITSSHTTHTDCN